MTHDLAPRPGVGAFFVGDECLIFSEPAQSAFTVNHTAGVIWALAEEGLTFDGIVEQLGSVFAVPEDQARGYVTAATAEFRAKDLLNDSAYVEPLISAALDVTALQIRPSSLFQAETTYRLGGSDLHFRFSTPEQAAIIHQILSHLHVGSHGADPVLIDVFSAQNSEIEIYVDGVRAAACCDLSELAPIVKGIVWAEAVNRSEFLFGFHAGAVATESGALLLPGQAGSGKSTLTALLVAAGFDYFSDEMAVLEEGTFRVRPLPLALCVKDTGIAALAPTFPILKTLPIHNRGDGKRVVYMPPPRAAEISMSAARQIKAIVFPTYIEGSPLRLTQLETAETVRRLLTECLVAGKHLELAHIAQLIEWVESVERHALQFGSAPEAIAALQRLMRD